MKKIITLLLMCVLFLPVQAIDEQSEIVSQNSQEQEKVNPAEAEDLNINIPIPEKNVMPAATPSSTEFKVPAGKKQLAKKFIIAMLCVAGCSVFLYLSLSVYNRIRGGILVDNTPLQEGEEPLEAPQDLTEAVKTFVEKTHWNGV